MVLSITCRTISLGRSLGLLYGISLGVTYRAISGRPQDVGRKHPGDVGRRHPLALHIGPYEVVPWTLYFHVLRMSLVDVLGTSAGDVPQRYLEDHMGTSRGRL